MSQRAPKLNTKILFFPLRQTDEDEGDDATQSCQVSPTLHEHRHPTVNCAWGVPLYTADFRLRIEQNLCFLCSRWHRDTLV